MAYSVEAIERARQFQELAEKSSAFQWLMEYLEKLEKELDDRWWTDGIPTEKLHYIRGEKHMLVRIRASLAHDLNMDIVQEAAKIVRANSGGTPTA